MTTEAGLRAAAEYCRDRDGYEFSTGPAADGDFIEKAKTLATAWLAEHPADDVEAVTAEWLAATGWELYDARPHWRRWRRDVCVDDHGFGIGKTTHWLDIHEPQTGADGSVWWPINFWQQHENDDKPEGVAWLSWVPHTTRGDVRRLLAALGIGTATGGGV